MTKRKPVDIAWEFRLHLVRTHKNQAAAAAHYGVSQSTISLIKNGKKEPSDAMLYEMGFKRIQAAPEYVKA